jgi:hypothetical protein
MPATGNFCAFQSAVFAYSHTHNPVILSEVQVILSEAKDLRNYLIFLIVNILPHQDSSLRSE